MKKFVTHAAVFALFFSLTGLAGAGDDAKDQRKRSLDNPRVIQKFDKDGDGKLNEDEKKEALKQIGQVPQRGNREELIKKYDANKNGKLDPDEEEKARKEAGGRVGRSREDLLKKFDKDGDGKLSEEEREAARKSFRKGGAASNEELLKKYDANKDGKLDREELRKAREDGAAKTRPATDPKKVEPNGRRPQANPTNKQPRRIESSTLNRSSAVRRSKPLTQ